MQLYETDSGGFRLKRLSILILEGDRSAADEYATFFYDHNWDVDFCFDLNAAQVAISGAKPYNFILSGEQVSGARAEELVKLIRDRDHRQQTIIIAITKSDETRHLIFAAGANEVLQDPVSPEALQGAVRRHLLSARGASGGIEQERKHGSTGLGS